MAAALQMVQADEQPDLLEQIHGELDALLLYGRAAVIGGFELTADGRAALELGPDSDDDAGDV